LETLVEARLRKNLDWDSRYAAFVEIGEDQRPLEPKIRIPLTIDNQLAILVLSS
jgi:hypothetical protein